MIMNADTSMTNPRTLMVGLGDGGCNVVVAMARHWKGTAPLFMAVNTDVRPWATLDEVSCVQIGTHALKGMGTGGDPRLGRRAAEADLSALREAVEGMECVIFVVGLGGGTGTGAAPLLVEAARKAGAFTLCFAMLPFEFEGERRREYAQRGLLTLQDVADSVIVLPNQRLLAVVDDRANIAQALRTSDEGLARGIQAVWRALGRRGVIRVDFAHVREMIRLGDGMCLFACAEASGPDRIAGILDALKADAALCSGQTLAETPAYLVSVIGSPDFSLREIDRLMAGIQALAPASAQVLAGIDVETEWTDRVWVTLLAVEKIRAGDAPVVLPRAGAAFVSAGVLPDKPADSSARRKAEQPDLFDRPKSDRFSGTEPTIVDGHDLDLPTFVRRGIIIRKPVFDTY